MNKLKMKTTATLLIAIFMISAMAVVIPVSAADVEYSFTTTVGVQPVDIDVTDDGTHITWTIDYPLEAPFETTEGNGAMTVGLIIALDGNGEAPAFQIHNNDGSDATFDWGTWLYSPWGPTITDGWFGWHSNDDNTLVTNPELDWVSCTGGRYNEVNPDGVFTISIDKSKLGNDFHWALNLAIGTGFWKTYLVYEQMSCPVGATAYFDWTNPIVNKAVPNYEYALLAIPDAATSLSGDGSEPIVSISVLPTDVAFGRIILGATTVFPEPLVITNGEETNTFVTAELIDDDGFYIASLHYGGIPIGTWDTTILKGGKYSGLLSLVVDRYAEAGLHTATLVFWAEEVLP